MPISKSVFTLAAVPLAIAGYVTVMGTTGACPTCEAIVSTVTGGGTPASSTETVAQQPVTTDDVRPEAEAGGMFAIPLVDLDGNPTTLAGFAGRPMLIEVWATWCGPCRRVRSVIKEHQAELESVATLVGVSVDQGGASTVKGYLAKSPSPGMHEFMVTPEFRAAIAPLDRQNTIPKLIYVGPDGRIANLSYGVSSADFMTGLLRNLGAADAG